MLCVFATWRWFGVWGTTNVKSTSITSCINNVPSQVTFSFALLKAEITQCKEKRFQFAIITGDTSCKTKADVIVLIQDSEKIASTTVQSAKTVLRRLITHLGSETQDYNFALATYATTRRMSCFGSAEETISYIDTEYHHGGSGRNLLKPALSEMILDQFNKRRDDRKGDDTAKVSTVMTVFPF